MGNDDGLQLIAANGYAILFLIGFTMAAAPSITDPFLYYGLVLFWIVFLCYALLAAIWSVS